ncbi:MAG TPA: M48 family metallopeptidase [Limnochordia bacterium]|nr:M48 family metallopeptidase [Limnochordia bacterium]HPZ31609.1 M48 family metallopeptidase [Limnochordia bacterium]HQD71445.1 M48 family metallopeptidase [Limnochordia bacterium]
MDVRLRFRILYYLLIVFFIAIYLIAIWCMVSDRVHFSVTLSLFLTLHVVITSIGWRLPIIQARAGIFQTLTEGPIHEITTELLRKAELKLKQIHVFIQPAKSFNAMVNGYRDYFYIIVTKPLLETLSNEELRAILAHEIAHIKHKDGVKRLFDLWMLIILPMGLLTTANVLPKDSLSSNLIGTIGIVSFVVLLLRWLSNTRKGEYAADRYASELIGDKEALIRALTILNEKSRYKPEFAVYRRPLLTHPDLNSRIANLRKA